MWRLLGLDGCAGLVDPHLGGQRGCLRAFALEPDRAGGVGLVEDVLPAGLDGPGGAVVHGGGGVQADAGVPVLVVVVGEEDVAEVAGLAEGFEAAGECRAVFEGLVVSTNAGGGERWRFTERGAVWEMEVAGPPEPLCGERL